MFNNFWDSKPLPQTIPLKKSIGLQNNVYLKFHFKLHFCIDVNLHKIEINNRHCSYVVLPVPFPYNLP